jgi:uncharacterized membrane protein
MKLSRLEALADGIFAIVMTLLVLELKIPSLSGVSAIDDLPVMLSGILPALLAYILSFAVLFTFWRAHNFVISGFAKELDMWLSNINAVFLFFVGMVPFTSFVLGRYSGSQAAIILFGANVIAIGLALFWMRQYALTSPNIATVRTNRAANRRANIRILMPVILAALAITISFYDTRLSFVLFTVAIAFNIFPASMHLATWLLDNFWKRL